MLMLVFSGLGYVRLETLGLLPVCFTALVGDGGVSPVLSSVCL